MDRVVIKDTWEEVTQPRDLNEWETRCSKMPRRNIPSRGNKKYKLLRHRRVSDALATTRRPAFLGKRKQRRQGLRMRSGRQAGQEERGREQAPGRGLKVLYRGTPLEGSEQETVVG